jgi:recombination protein RecA
MAKAAKPAVGEASSGLKRLKSVMTEMRKEHGVSVIGSAAKLLSNVLRISTQSLAYDFVLGGGFAIGRVNLIVGDESSGKTSTALNVIGEGQRLCRNCYRKAQDFSVVMLHDDIIDPDTGEVLEPAEYEARASCDCYNKKLFRPVQVPTEKDEEFNNRIERYKKNSYDEHRCVVIDVEGTFDKGWAKKRGVIPELLLYVCPDSLEEIVDIYDQLMRTGEIDMFVLDSIAAMTPTVETEKSMEDKQRAEAAKLVNKFVRKATASANVMSRETGRSPTQIWINQLRTDLNITYGSKDMIPGGRAQRFAASIIVKMWQSEWDVNKGAIGDVDKSHELSIGTEVSLNFDTIKNKTASAHRRGSYRLIVHGEDAGAINELDFVMDMAERFGFVEKLKSAWLFGDQEFKTKKALLAHVTEPVVFDELKLRLLTVMLAHGE